MRKAQQQKYVEAKKRKAEEHKQKCLKGMSKATLEAVKDMDVDDVLDDGYVLDEGEYYWYYCQVVGDNVYGMVVMVVLEGLNMEGLLFLTRQKCTNSIISNMVLNTCLTSLKL